MGCAYISAPSIPIPSQRGFVGNGVSVGATFVGVFDGLQGIGVGVAVSKNKGVDEGHAKAWP